MSFFGHYYTIFPFQCTCIIDCLQLSFLVLWIQLTVEQLSFKVVILQNGKKWSCSYHFQTYFFEFLIKKKSENMYCSTICDVTYMSYTIVKARALIGPLGAWRWGPMDPKFFWWPWALFLRLKWHKIRILKPKWQNRTP